METSTPRSGPSFPAHSPNIDLDATINLHDVLENIAQPRGGAAHDAIIADDRKVRDAEELWDLVMGLAGGGFLAQFHSALGLTGNDGGQQRRSTL